MLFYIQHEEEWKRKVERENNKITEKISHIMRTRGGVDNRNNYEKKRLVECGKPILVYMYIYI